MRVFVALLLMTASGFAQSNHRLFVLNKAADTLSVVNTGSLAVERTVPVGRGPHEMAISPDGTKAYVGNAEGNSISVIDLRTYTETKKITTPDFSFPHAIIFTPDGRRALVTSEQAMKIVLIDAVADAVIRSIDTDQGGTHMAVINKAGTWAYFTNRESNTVSFMDLGNYRTVANVAVGEGGEGFALSPDETEIWVSDRTANTVSVIDVAARRVVATLPIGVRPNRVTFSPDGSHVIIPVGSGEIYVFDRETRQNIKKLQVGRSPGGIVATPDGSRIFVACAVTNDVQVIDTQTWSVVAKVAVGEGPDGMALR